jgi:capsular exopolysaccharide synthesis family protein
MISFNRSATLPLSPVEPDPNAQLRLCAEQITLDTTRHSRLVFMTEPHGLAVESYRLLRTRLCAANPKGGVLLVTSPHSGDGKTLTSTNLAWCLAKSGKNACLVDLDFRAPGLGRALNHEVYADDSGVTEVLEGSATLSQAIRRVSETSLYVLAIKEPQESASQLLTSEALKSLLSSLRNAFEWVILDMPPAIPMSDVSEVLPNADGALMVVRSGRTGKALLQPTIDILGSKLWGAVLNDAVISGGEYYYGYNRYGKRRKPKE